MRDEEDPPGQTVIHSVSLSQICPELHTDNVGAGVPMDG